MMIARGKPGSAGFEQVLVELLRLVEEVPAQCKAAGLVCGQASGSIPTSAKKYNH